MPLLQAFFVAAAVLPSAVNAWCAPPSFRSNWSSQLPQQELQSRLRPFHNTDIGTSKKSIVGKTICRKTSGKQQDILDFINEPIGNSVGDDFPTVPPEEDDLADLVECVVRAADGRKAEQIVALRVSPITTLTSFMIILSGNSRPQNQAIAAAIQEDVLEQYDMRPGSNGVPEGSADSGWMVLDYGSVMVHIMTPKSRLYYNIEGQWREKGGEPMNVEPFLITADIPQGMQQKPSASSSSDSVQDEEDDPFWS